MMKALAIALSLVLAGACVSKGKYETLQKKLAETEADRDAKVQTLEEALDAEQKKVAEHETKISELEGQLAEKEQAIATLETQKSDLEGELTAVVKDRARLKASAEELKQALAELSKRKAEAEKRVAEFRDLLAKFKSLVDSGKLKVKIADGRMVLELSTDVLFASGKADLSDEGIAAIGEVSKVLATMPSRRYQIEGHTDNVPIKSSRRYKSNWELAAARALNVLTAMREAGLPGQSLSAASFGEFRPVASNDTDAGRSANRRIEIVVVPDLSKLPGFDELNQAVGSK